METVVQPAIPTPAPKRAPDLTFRDMSWFTQRVDRGRKEIFSETVTITPEIAKRLLENNPDNRKLNERVVLAITRDIKAGHWQLNGESIIITQDGELNDGQNRLTAIIRADMPVQSLIAFGVTRKSRMTVDMGISRSAAQFLMMRGVANSNRIAAAARLQLMFLSGTVSGAGLRTKQDVVAEFEDYSDEILRAHEAVGRSKFVDAVSGYSFLTIAYLNIHRADSLHCDTFFEQLAIGANLDRDDPILWLRQKLVELKNTKQKIRAESRLELVIRYWNAWAAGAKMKSHIKPLGAYPKIKPATERK